MGVISWLKGTGLVPQAVSVANPLPITGSVTTTAPTPPATIASSQTSVTGAATQILAASATRVRATIVMHGAVDIFVGPSGVTTANGTLLLGTKGSAITIEGGAAIFGISSAGAVTVGALTVGP